VVAPVALHFEILKLRCDVLGRAGSLQGVRQAVLKAPGKTAPLQAAGDRRKLHNSAVFSSTRWPSPNVSTFTRTVDSRDKLPFQDLPFGSFDVQLGLKPADSVVIVEWAKETVTARLTFAVRAREDCEEDDIWERANRRVTLAVQL
jgi:hypothetical protein